MKFMLAGVVLLALAGCTVLNAPQKTNYAYGEDADVVIRLYFDITDSNPRRLYEDFDYIEIAIIPHLISIIHSRDGWIYATQAADEIISNTDPVINLIRWNPDTGEVITLFCGSILPEIDGVLSMWYQDIDLDNDNISFTVVVARREVIGFYDVYSNLLTAEFEVDKSGGNLTLLNGQFLETTNFAITKRINDELPYFTFRFIGETTGVVHLNVNEPRVWIGFHRSKIQEIAITDENGDLIQIMTNLDLLAFFNPGPESLIFADWNFDGYLDFAIPSSWSTAYFLWNGEEFVRSKELELLGGRNFIRVCNETTRLIISGGRMSRWFTEYYEYTNGEITLVRLQEKNLEVTGHEERDGDFIYTGVYHFLIWELIDGDMTLIDEWTEEWGDAFKPAPSLCTYGFNMPLLQC